MPLKPVTDTVHMPVETAADVYALLETGIALAEHPSASRRRNGARDLEDHFYYLGAVHPELAQLIGTRLIRLSVTQLAVFPFALSTWLYLLQGADDADVDYLLQELGREPLAWTRLTMLAAVGTPTALTGLAATARRHNLIEEIGDMGFDIPPDGQPARQRFTPWRRAIKKIPCTGTSEDILTVPHPVGLPIDSVADEASTLALTWHYLSVSLAELEGMPEMATRQLHLVSPRLFMGWTVSCTIQTGGLYHLQSIEQGELYESAGLDDLLDAEDNDKSPDRGHVELLPYDDRLIYCNAHTRLTDKVFGDVGGPPSGLYPNPKCTQCGRLMFHVLTVEDCVRPYGDEWRSLYVCEDCQSVACNATSWN